MLKHQVADSSYQLGSPLVYIFESPLCTQRKTQFNVKTVHGKSFCRLTITHVYFYGRTSCPVSCGLKLDGRIAAAVLNPRYEDLSYRFHGSSPSLSFCSHSLFKRPCCFSSFLAILTAAQTKQCHVRRARDVTPTRATHATILLLRGLVRTGAYVPPPLNLLGYRHPCQI